MKLYTNKLDHFFYYTPKIVAEMTQAKVQTVVVSEEEQKSEDFKAKRGGHGKFPMLELADGSMIYESLAIAEYIARQSSTHSGAVTGRTAFEEAQIEQWALIAATNVWSHSMPIAYNTLGFAYDAAKYADAVKNIKDVAKMVNNALVGKTFLVGNRFSLADVAMFVAFIVPFSFVLDGGFRKAMPNVSDWFARCAAQSAVINVCGNIKMCEKPVKAIDWTKLPVVAAPALRKVEEVETKAEAKPAADDDDFDPFADESEEDEEAEKAKMERMKEIAKTAKNHGKAKPVAKSIILWEVKPWGEETDLDELAKMILAIEMEGLAWKTEYKKEPIAYGVFKLIIGAVVEDEKVSTDLIQEQIEAFEDHVQSIDIQSFNKL
jgi:elongation factor 1-beta